MRVHSAPKAAAFGGHGWCAALRRAAAAMLLACLPLTIGCGGCRDSSSPPGTMGGVQGEGAGQWQRERFTGAIDNLHRLEQFESGATVDEILRRFALVDQPSAAGPEPPLDPLRMTWPEPEMLRQIVDWLNQWVRFQPPMPVGDRHSEFLRTALPEPLRTLPMVQDVDQPTFSHYDGFALQEAVWLLQVSTWARGERLDELSRAVRLFDWTVRNIQLEGDGTGPKGQPGDRTAQFSWETLLLGRGTAVERAWVFILLARQQRIEAALLAVPGSGDERAGTLRPWAVGVLIDRQVYLFDSALGLPIPAPDGIQRNRQGALAIRPATLAQVADDPSLLRRLDLEAAHPYPVGAEQLKGVVALAEASPAYLAGRMKLVEQQPSDQPRMVLSTDVSGQLQRWKAVPQLSQARLWLHPYQTFRQRLDLGADGTRRRLLLLLPLYAAPGAPLYKGRLLHLKGKFSGPETPIQYYQAARPSNDQVAEVEKQLIGEYTDKLMAPRQGAAKDDAVARQRAKAAAAQAAARQAMILLRGKQDASYWLGLLAFEQGNYATAVDYFARWTLDAAPDGPWTHGARYNLGRSLEVVGRTAQAIAVYESDRDGPQSYGTRLRARWLAEDAKAEKTP